MHDFTILTIFILYYVEVYIFISYLAFFVNNVNTFTVYDDAYLNHLVCSFTRMTALSQCYIFEIVRYNSNHSVRPSFSVSIIRIMLQNWRVFPKLDSNKMYFTLGTCIFTFFFV